MYLVHIEDIQGWMFADYYSTPRNLLLFIVFFSASKKSVAESKVPRGADWFKIPQ